MKRMERMKWTAIVAVLLLTLLVAARWAMAAESPAAGSDQPARALVVTDELMTVAAVLAAVIVGVTQAIKNRIGDRVNEATWPLVVLGMGIAGGALCGMTGWSPWDPVSSAVGGLVVALASQGLWSQRKTLELLGVLSKPAQATTDADAGEPKPPQE